MVGLVHASEFKAHGEGHVRTITSSVFEGSQAHNDSRAPAKSHRPDAKYTSKGHGVGQAWPST